MISDKNLSVIIQGELNPVFFPMVLDSIHRNLPNCELIISTWNNDNNINILKSYNNIIKIFNDDPGPIDFYLLMDNDGYKDICCNNNRQILSSLNGLKRSSRPYALKIRSDTVIESTNFIDIYNKYNSRLNNEYFNNRVLTGIARKSNYRPFYISDMYMLGSTSDLLDLWTIPLQPNLDSMDQLNKEEFNSIFLISGEQYVWSNFIRKKELLNFKSRWDTRRKNVQICDRLIFNNLIIVEHKLAGFKNLKYNNIDDNISPKYIDFKIWKKNINSFKDNPRDLIAKREYLKYSKASNKLSKSDSFEIYILIDDEESINKEIIRKFINNFHKITFIVTKKDLIDHLPNFVENYILISKNAVDIFSLSFNLAKSDYLIFHKLSKYSDSQLIILNNLLSLAIKSKLPIISSSGYFIDYKKNEVIIDSSKFASNTLLNCDSVFPNNIVLSCNILFENRILFDTSFKSLEYALLDLCLKIKHSGLRVYCLPNIAFNEPFNLHLNTDFALFDKKWMAKSYSFPKYLLVSNFYLFSYKYLESVNTNHSIDKNISLIADIFTNHVFDHDDYVYYLLSKIFKTIDNHRYNFFISKINTLKY